VENTKTISVLENLLETVQNGRKGFADAAEKFEEDGNEPLAAEMRQMSQQRLRMSNELKALAAKEGAPIHNGDGSVAGTLHRSWMALRDALSGGEPHAVLAAVEQGEDHAVAEYERALSSQVPSSVKSVLQRQFDEVTQSHDRVRDLRDRNK
jgi:uncharacterized protein (TIGR02284 family)